MRIHLLISTIVLGQLPNGVPLPEVIRKYNVNSRFDEYCKLLKTENLGHLCSELRKVQKMNQKVYDCVYSRECTFFNAVESLFKQSNQILNKYNNCVEKDLKRELDNWSRKAEEMLQMIDESPKSQTCYKDLLDWIRELKSFRKENIINNTNYSMSEQIYLEKKLVYPEKVKFVESSEYKAKIDFKSLFEQTEYYLERMLLDYTNVMISLKRNQKAPNYIIEQRSIDYLMVLAEAFTQICDSIYYQLSSLQNNANLDLRRLINETKEYYDNCCEAYTSINFIAKAEKNIVMSEIKMMELYASCHIFIIEDDRERLLGCEEHVPYYKQKPNEKLVSAFFSDHDSTHETEGIDENSRPYQRICIRKQINETTIDVQETINYLDRNEIVDRKYVFKCK